MVLGLLCISLGYFLVGPSPLITFWVNPSIPLVLAALVLAAMGGGLAMVPASPLMLAGAKAAGLGEKESMDGIAALATLAGGDSSPPPP